MRPSDLALLTLALCTACTTVGTRPANRRAGPENVEACPGARWTGEIASYDLASGEATLAVDAAPGAGERIVAVLHRTGFTDRPVEAVLETSADGLAWSAVAGKGLVCWSSDSGNNGELGESARDCVGLKQIRLGYEVPATAAAASPRFRLVLRAAGTGEKATGRARVQVVPGACRGLDVCWRASGNNCDGAPLSNCDEDEAGHLRCPTSVGSEAHDSCCSRWGEDAFLCGRCGSAVSDRANLAGCMVADPPAGLEPRLRSKPADGFPGGYIPCRGEWDMAFRDVAAVPSRLWSFDFDPLDLTWRPTEITRSASVRGKPAAVPLPGAFLFPADAKVRTIDAELGWCASGRWSEAAPGVARCE
ncbi:MAG TPA: hypothetical protein VGK67_24845 [Myxococcales bacterium]|jgi:hypothetical protein